MKPWVGRFRHHSFSCAGHIAWGALAGLCGGIDGVVLFSGGMAYQMGSAWRKSESGRIDTVGMDCFDYAVGYVTGMMVRRFTIG